MLRETFKDHVAGTAFKTVDDELRVIGKFGQISMIGDKFDLWLVKPDIEPLSERKLTGIMNKMPVGWHFHRLDGEAWTQTADIDGLISILPFIGVKKRRKVSEETRQRLANNLAKYKGLTGE